MLTLGNKIKKVREIKGFKQEYMAEILGISQPSYSKIETDEAGVSQERLEQIAKALEVSVADILAFDEKLFFNQTNNKTAVGYNNTVNQYGVTDNERKLYEDKIKLLEEMLEMKNKEIERLKTSK
ncbi:MAG: helix-turn-helix domain-containing protein [Sporocytophaga sp.]|jgi:transcriptional regulator with XRE-family HTH domain|nr:helix-turn-helix domain-containing protein [Sporocytophaga sp.]